MLINGVSRNPHEMENSDTRGILTETDREWLKGEIEYEQRQTAAKRRAQIRERVALALQDFKMLTDHWPQEESRKVLEELDDPERSASEIIEFLYVFLNEPATDAEKMIDEDTADQAVAFREALRRGIKSGKGHFDDTPGEVLIDANTELFELPSVDELKRAMNTNQWRDANDHVQGAFDASDDADVDQEEAAQNHHMELHLEIEEELYSRRQRSDIKINRHDELVRSPGFRGKRED
jgi:hypothetical protein